MKKILLAATLVLGMLGLAKADTTTSRFLLTKPDVGSTNWGPKINTNYDLIDLAAGVAISNTFTSSNTFNAAVAFGAQVLNSAGSAGTPSISFTGSPTSGFYLGASGVIEVGTLGVQAFEIGSSSVTSKLPLFLPVGSVSAPGLTFAGFASSGFFMNASTVGWSVGGSTVVYGDSTGLVVPAGKTLTVNGTLAPVTLTVSGAFTPQGNIIDRNLTGGTTWDVLHSSGSGQAPIWGHAGLILQSTQSYIVALTTASSSSSFIKTGLKVTLAPKFATSILRINVQTQLQNSNPSADTCELGLFENGTNLLGGTNDWVRYTMQAAGNHNFPMMIGPWGKTAGVTTTLTYEVYVRNSAGGSTCTVGSAGVSNIVVDEIGQ